MSEPIHQLTVERMRRVMRKRMEDGVKYCTNAAYNNWRLEQKRLELRQRWLYGFVTATTLALIGWLVAGGCR